MKIKAQQLKQFIDKANKIIPKTTILPILGHVCIRDNKMIVTNLEHFVVMPIDDSMSCTIPFKHLKTVLKQKPKEIEILKGEGQDVYLKFNGKSLKVEGLDFDEYPSIPDNDFKKIMVFDESFIELLKNQIPYVSNDMLISALTGIFLRLGNDITICSTDGHILRTNTLNNETNEELKVIIPLLTVTLLNQKPVQSTFMSINDDGWLKFDLQGLTLYSKSIDEKYPDFESIIPETFDYTVTISVLEFIDMVKSVEPFVNKTTNLVKLDISNNGLIIYAKDVENNTELSVDLDIQSSNLGNKIIQIGYNAKYLLTVLKSIKTETAKWSFKNPLSPMVFRGTDNDQSINLLMPVRITDED